METGVRTRAVSFSLREDSHWARRVLDASRVRSIRSWRHPGPRPRSSLASAWPRTPRYGGSCTATSKPQRGSRSSRAAIWELLWIAQQSSPSMYWNQWDATGGKPVGPLHATSAGITVSSRNRSNLVLVPRSANSRGLHEGCSQSKVCGSPGLRGFGFARRIPLPSH